MKVHHSDGPVRTQILAGSRDCPFPARVEHGEGIGENHQIKGLRG